MRYFTKSGFRPSGANVMTYLIAAKVNDWWHKVVPSFFKDFFSDFVAVKKSRDLISISHAIHLVDISKLISLPKVDFLMS